MVEPEFLLDTNILIYLLDGTNPSLRGAIEACSPGQIVTSALCFAEAAYGLRGDDAGQRGLWRLSELFVPLPFDVKAASCFPEVPFRRGKLDRLIAAHVLALDLTLITNNQSDFADVPGLRIENWTLPRTLPQTPPL